MDKEKLLTFLLNNISCFKGVSLEDFCMLNSLETAELGFMNDKVSRVTPLLKQIADYSLIKAVLTKAEIENIDSYIDEDNCMLTDSIKVIETCYQYIEILKEENCHHPSILTTISLINGIYSYNHFNEIIVDLITMVDGKFQDELIDFGNMIDDGLLEITDEIFKHVTSKLEKGFITNKEELILNLSNYVQNFLNIIMLLSKNMSVSHEKQNHNIWYMNNCFVHLFENQKIAFNHNLTLLNVLDNLAIIMQKVEKYEEEYPYPLHPDIEELLENLKESYIIYQSYRYKYLKDSYQESKLLEKCKKNVNV